LSEKKSALFERDKRNFIGL